MKYQLKSDPAVKCEATPIRREPGHQPWTEIDFRDDALHGFKVPLPTWLFEKTWEPVPEKEADTGMFVLGDLLEALRLRYFDRDREWWSMTEDGDAVMQRLDGEMVAEYIAGRMLDPEVLAKVRRAYVGPDGQDAADLSSSVLVDELDRIASLGSGHMVSLKHLSDLLCEAASEIRRLKVRDAELTEQVLNLTRDYPNDSRHRLDVDCMEFCCLPEVNPDHYCTPAEAYQFLADAREKIMRIEPALEEACDANRELKLDNERLKAELSAAQTKADAWNEAAVFARNMTTGFNGGSPHEACRPSEVDMMSTPKDTRDEEVAMLKAELDATREKLIDAWRCNSLLANALVERMGSDLGRKVVFDLPVPGQDGIVSRHEGTIVE